MTNQGINEFYQTAVSYCNLIENFENKNLKILLLSLLDLYSKALHLPDVEPEQEGATDIDLPIPQIKIGQYDHYWEVFNPYQFEQPLGATLSDDILDIYKDVKKGILLYQRNEQIEAIWEWKFGFEIHWGSHAVDAIRTLHYVNVM
jgi:hypothetical protein